MFLQPVSPAAILAIAGLACASPAEVRPGSDGGSTPARPLFVHATTTSGLDFRHRNGASGRLYYPELMQGGVGLVDYDGDARLDVYLVQSGDLPPTGASPGNLLLHNEGDGRLRPAEGDAGAADTGYGSGVTAADYDRDGWVDLYVTNLGPDRLYRNRGDGTFEDVTEAAGIAGAEYSSSAAFTDVDNDGDLDLFVAQYVRWAPELERVCLGPNGVRSYCNPSHYEPLADRLYRNRGDGTFEDISAASGLAARPGAGLGVVAADFDGDGWTDIYVANDQMPNHLWRNRGDGTFVEEALLRGCALNEAGQPEAGMGIAIGDPDADGDWDLFVVHLSGESNTFYRNERGYFRDVTDELGLGTVSIPYTGFGTSFFDFDNDGHLDLLIANGKVGPRDAAAPRDFAEPNQLLRGLPGGRFSDVSRLAGEAFSALEVSRGTAIGDLDNDGDLDLVVLNNDGRARLLRNEAARGRSWLTVDLCGAPRWDRHALGAVVTVRHGEGSQRRLVQSAGSYASSQDPRAAFGLGDYGGPVEVEVRWPDGTVQIAAEVPVNRILYLEPDDLESPRCPGHPGAAER